MRPLVLAASAFAALLLPLAAAGCGSSSDSTTTTAVSAGRLGAAADVPITAGGPRDPKPGAYAGIYCPLSYDCAANYADAKASAKHYCNTNGGATPSAYTDSRGAKFPYFCFTLAANARDVTNILFDGRRPPDTVMKDTVSYAFFTACTDGWCLQPKWSADSTHLIGMASQSGTSRSSSIRGEIYRY